MSVDSTECSFTITEMRKDDPSLKEYDELREEEKQSSFVATIQLLPGSDKLEIEEMNGQLAWSCALHLIILGVSWNNVQRQLSSKP